MGAVEVVHKIHMVQVFGRVGTEAVVVELVGVVELEYLRNLQIVFHVGQVYK